MKNFDQHGRTIEFVAAALIAAGDAIPLADMVVVAVDDVAEGEVGVGYAEGVFELPKTAANEIAQGDQVYLTAAGVITSTATSNTPAGKAWEAKGNGDEAIKVKINA